MSQKLKLEQRRRGHRTTERNNVQQRKSKTESPTTTAGEAAELKRRELRTEEH
jgi:hypothetical protein